MPELQYFNFLHFKYLKKKLHFQKESIVCVFIYVCVCVCVHTRVMLAISTYLIYLLIFIKFEVGIVCEKMLVKGGETEKNFACRLLKN
jgi:hypothetical protein